MQYDGTLSTAEKIMSHFDSKDLDVVVDNQLQNCIAIRTLEGTMIAGPGDWICQGIEGELYPCKNSIFEKTYEEITDRAEHVRGYGPGDGPSKVITNG